MEQELRLAAEADARKERKRSEEVEATNRRLREREAAERKANRDRARKWGAGSVLVGFAGIMAAPFTGGASLALTAGGAVGGAAAVKKYDDNR